MDPTTFDQIPIDEEIVKDLKGFLKENTVCMFKQCEGEIISISLPDHMIFQLQLLMFSVLAFFLALPVIKRTLTISLDVDWFWRRAGAMFAAEFEGQWLRAYRALGGRGYRTAKRLLEELYRTHGPEGAMARTRPSGYMALWMTILLSVFLLLSFL
jgi:multicomponent Na+:H+ antiporter subunit D